MTHTASDRDEIYDAHLGRSWALFATTDRHYGFRRGEVMVSISFAEDGAILKAERLSDGPDAPESTRELYVVTEWLAGTEPLSDDLHARALDENADHDRARIARLADALDASRQLADLRLGQVIRLERQLAEARERIATLETLRETWRTDYRAARERITELEDQAGPMRANLAGAAQRLARIEAFRERLAGLAEWGPAKVSTGEVEDTLRKLLDS